MAAKRIGKYVVIALSALSGCESEHTKHCRDLQELETRDNAGATNAERDRSYVDAQIMRDENCPMSEALKLVTHP
jgi:hypothetical protein